MPGEVLRRARTSTGAHVKLELQSIEVLFAFTGYQVSEAKGPPYGSSMYSRDKYHDTINGEALRSPLNDVEETFHEDILMKEIMKQEAEPSKSPKIEHKVPTRAHQNHQRWPSAAENSCPDILKNGHNYVKSSNNLDIVSHVKR
ncbi:UNVERIFIED_CONTAM: hypothetical protein NCL1_28022 [Trichonephila clavipes]